MRRIEELATFIRSSFTSIWSLELLLHLKAQPWATRTREQLVAELRASEAVVNNSMKSLYAAGLIIQDEEESYRYSPASPELAALVDEIEAVYRTKPDAVRRVIVVGTDNLSAFADAFKLRKD